MGDGVLDELADVLGRACPAARYAVITDSTVALLYAERVAAAAGGLAPTTVFPFPAGEWNKTRETWAEVTDRLLTAELGRDGAILALGGGVVGDLAGFIAATYLRGLPYVQIPTTLLAMVDSSIGGKTGVDTAQGKNLVGAFYQPRAVVADVETLTTLPPGQLAAGMAEALKHGVVADAGHVTRLLEARDAIVARNRDALNAMVRDSIALKAGVVAADERERGRRAILNFGHTVGHALEATFGYQLLHGEAVAIGMLAEAALGGAMGITDSEVGETLRTALEAFALPLEPPAPIDVGRALDVMRKDKKVRGGTVRFALPTRLGEMAGSDASGWTVEVPESEIHAVLRRFG